MLTRNAKRRKIAEEEATAAKNGDSNESSAPNALSTAACHSPQTDPLSRCAANRNLTLNYMLSNLLLSFTEYCDAETATAGLWADAAMVISDQILQEQERRKMPEDRQDREAFREWFFRVHMGPDLISALLQELNQHFWGCKKAGGMMRKASHDVGIVMIR